MQQQPDGTIKTAIRDAESIRDIQIGPFRELKVAEWTRLLGGNATGAVVNARVWSVANVGTGTTTSSAGLFNLRTGTTANSSSIMTSTDIARYISTSTNAYVSGIRLPDGGTVNNVRKWGAFSATDGVYFKMNGTTFQVCRLQDGVETAISNGSFNGTNPNLDTNFHTYEIHYVAGTAVFYQDRIRIHTLTSQTSSLASTIHFPIRTENTNSAGSTSDIQLLMRGNGIHRYGRPFGRPRFDYINTASTTIIKREPGTLHRIFVNRTSTVGISNITIYDSLVGSGAIIAVISLAGIENRTLSFDLDFNVGLTVVSDSTSVQFTVIWE